MPSVIPSALALATNELKARTTRFAILHQEPLTSDDVGGLLYLAATVLCFASWTLHHVFANHAQAYFWLRIDPMSIARMMQASPVSFILASFECRRGERWAYTSLVTTAAAALSLVRLLKNTSPKGLQSRAN
ncbi:hypothetical protein COCHEDRAFT_1209224 [Bipolaris maydis C5]|uniref:Uncharacterized protein n=1 Tax=Cochliobolus heterostrophus (strain C5 / ATCC 48332 / race O) TaxID=701091 RepID=M2TIZ4_COCH5|nr:hypothetical protein COCHEDRAFT_1209224 [Bipolaris maydis C5]KAJ5029794.1 hypothetical protein J3E73DRAFT_367215 [Bipolaris maydis]KAJ6203052.1 hypothetical protein J3E72DRAFT_369747 [Bipolaris maydis]KAJ6214401.1 hypothetical protein PSV09DRAFT_1209224 [Bipolaris maydis]KAJ6275591.1 hypothetical protein PSV08DRAFT_345990 [Bipolaris maydis]